MGTSASFLGRTLGHYRIVAELGAGGMGVVFRAHDERLDREVALKLLPPGVLGDETRRRRFQREAQALSRLTHPNIAIIHDFNTEDGVDFLATELVPGSSLHERIRLGPLSEIDVIKIAEQARVRLAWLEQQAKDHYVCPYSVGQVYVSLGEKERAYEWFDKAYRDRSD